MHPPETHIVTGATGYTGQYITRLLLSRGIKIINLTHHPERSYPFGNSIESHPYYFDKPDKLLSIFKQGTVFYNTYWVRYPHKSLNYDQAIENSILLFQRAKNAGIKKIVHISIANPSLDSPLPYYHGKALLEQYIQEIGLNHAILRPTVIFGPEDILINNIAWFIRKFPIFGIPGTSQYRIQPVYVNDLAELAVQSGLESENKIMDAVGPEIYTFTELIELISAQLNRNIKIIRLPADMVWFLTRLTGFFLGDIILTRNEIKGLMSDLLVSHNPPLGKTRFSDWLKSNGDTLGLMYRSEVKRHF